MHKLYVLMACLHSLTLQGVLNIRRCRHDITACNLCTPCQLHKLYAVTPCLHTSNLLGAFNKWRCRHGITHILFVAIMQRCIVTGSDNYFTSFLIAVMYAHLYRYIGADRRSNTLWTGNVHGEVSPAAACGSIYASNNVVIDDGTLYLQGSRQQRRLLHKDGD